MIFFGFKSFERKVFLKICFVKMNEWVIKQIICIQKSVTLSVVIKILKLLFEVTSCEHVLNYGVHVWLIL